MLYNQTFFAETSTVSICTETHVTIDHVYALSATRDVTLVIYTPVYIYKWRGLFDGALLNKCELNYVLYCFILWLFILLNGSNYVYMLLILT